MYQGYGSRGYQTYATNAVSTQSQGQLIIMLYDGAIKFIEKAQEGISTCQIQDAHTNIIKTQKIINELMVTLKTDTGEIAQQLLTLYQYMYQQLVQANIKKDADILGEVKELLVGLRDTWKQIC
ncbi:MAG: flagellar export chaperone FliS [Turicibacter sp.]|nr:flagellar export chaperone FliS [Turicibacter sp.]